MSKTSAQREVTIQRTTRTGKVLTQNIHISKWEAGDKPKGMQNAFRKAGWTLVPAKPSPAPKEVKPAKEKEVEE